MNLLRVNSIVIDLIFLGTSTARVEYKAMQSWTIEIYRHLNLNNTRKSRDKRTIQRGTGKQRADTSTKNKKIKQEY